MAFVNEYISSDDAKKYRIDEVNKKYIAGATGDNYWTIDRQRNIYLRQVTRGREEFHYESGWILYWMGREIFIQTESLTAEEASAENLENQGAKAEYGSNSRHFFLKIKNWHELGSSSNRLPADLRKQERNILAALKEALEIGKVGWGMYAPDDGRSLHVTLMVAKEAF